MDNYKHQASKGKIRCERVGTNGTILSAEADQVFKKLCSVRSVDRIFLIAPHTLRMELNTEDWKCFMLDRLDNSVLGSR